MEFDAGDGASRLSNVTDGTPVVAYSHLADSPLVAQITYRPRRNVAVNSYQTEYLHTWKKAFAEFLGWSEEQTVAWAQPLLAGMEGF